MRYTVIFLVALIGFSLAFQSPADVVLIKIDSLVSLSRTEQAAQTRLFVSQRERCTSEQEYRTREITDAEVASGAAREQISICKNEVPIVVSARKQSSSELKTTKEQLQQLDQEFDIFKRVNIARQAEHEEAIQNIETAYNIIGQFANGKAALEAQQVFVQISQRINKVFRFSIKHGYHKSMLPVVSAMVQITQGPATTVKTDELEKVVLLLRKLESKIREVEKQRAKDWSEFQTQSKRSNDLLSVQVRALSEIIKKYKHYHASLNTCVSHEKHILHLATGKFKRNTHILNSTVEMCNAFDYKYKTQTIQRKQYVKLLIELKSFVVKALKSFNNGLYSQ